MPKGTGSSRVPLIAGKPNTDFALRGIFTFQDKLETSLLKHQNQNQNPTIYAKENKQSGRVWAANQQEALIFVEETNSDNG